MFDQAGDGTARRGLNGRAIGAWVAGFLVYQWSVPTGPALWQDAIQKVLHGWLRLPFPLAGSAAGASLPAFMSAAVVYLALSAVRWGRARPG